MPISTELATDPAVLLAERQAARERILDDQIKRAYTVARELGRSGTCREKPRAMHGTCVGLGGWNELGCLCECHDPAPAKAKGDAR